MPSRSHPACLLALLGLLLWTPLAPAQTNDALLQKGLADLKADDYEQSLDDYTQALAADPKNAKAYYGRAYVYVKMSEDDKALADLGQAIEIDPRYEQAYYRRSFIYMIQGNYDGAGADLATAVQIDPASLKARYRKATVEMMAGKDDEAIADLDKVIAINPDFEQASARRTYCFMLKGDYAAALAQLNEAIKTNPRPLIANRLVWLLATCPDPHFRDGKRAVDIAMNHDDLTAGQVRVQLDTLAAAYAEAGDFPSAILWETKALSLHPDKATEDLEKSRLALYQAGKPYHVDKYEPEVQAVIL
jgi:tetratricopeptide (TPR) repeat protein